MVNIPTKTEQPLTKDTVLSINQRRIQGALDRQSIDNLNKNGANPAPQQRNNTPSNQARTGYPPVNTPVPRPTPHPSPQPAPQMPSAIPVPRLQNEARKGQKVPLAAAGTLQKVRASMGWNVINPNCDVDVSAFLLRNGRVLGDDWFVFYGQETSPDRSTVFSANSSPDRESISIDFTRLNASVDRIVFILTINEAAEKRLNFSMIKDAYIRIVDTTSNRELVSFKIEEYYSNVISMTIGEIYLHNGTWKFNAVGNGVGKDLAGLCQQYGVQVE